MPWCDVAQAASLGLLRDDDDDERVNASGASLAARSGVRWAAAVEAQIMGAADADVLFSATDGMAEQGRSPLALLP